MDKVITLVTAVLFAACAIALVATPAKPQSVCGLSVLMLAVLENLGQTQKETRSITDHEGTHVDYGLWVNDGVGSWMLTGTVGPTMCFVAGQPKGYSGLTLDDLLKGHDA